MRFVKFIPAVGLATVLRAVTIIGDRQQQEMKMEMGLAQVEAESDISIKHSCEYTASLKKGG